MNTNQTKTWKYEWLEGKKPKVYTMDWSQGVLDETKKIQAKTLKVNKLTREYNKAILKVLEGEKALLERRIKLLKEYFKV